MAGTLHLRYADVVSTLALIVALGAGGAYAVSQLPKHSVGMAQIKSGAVTSAKVKNGSLRTADFKAGQLPRGAQGAQGPRGADGRSALEPLRSGETIHGVAGAWSPANHINLETVSFVTLPVPAPVPLDNEHVNVLGGTDSTPAFCTGTYSQPTAAPGYVCVYPAPGSPLTGDSKGGIPWASVTPYGFGVYFKPDDNQASGLLATWAYTAP